MTRKDDPPGFVPHRCIWTRTFQIIGPILLILLGWLIRGVLASGTEAEVVKVQLVRMASDIAEIKDLIKTTVREKNK